MDYFQRYKQNKQSIVVERPNCSMNIKSTRLLLLFVYVEIMKYHEKTSLIFLCYLFQWP